MSDRVLLIGSGGREHALAWKLSQSSKVAHISVAPGNAGTATVPKTINIDLNVKDHEAVIQWCKTNRVNLVVVGPEDPLANGIADNLSSAGVPCFGPGKAGAEIEASKAFSKDFMDRHRVPTARWNSFKDAQPAKKYIQDAQHDALVVKASGLAAGKGVIVAADKAQAMEAVDLILTDKKFGGAGDTVVVEELLKGEEISVLAFTDGKNIAVMPAAQDHKRVFDGDRGPNTGGMGAYAPCPLVTSSMMDQIESSIIQRTVDGLRADGIHYIGVLFVGIMLTDDGPKVLEFNCRFGDPETESILPLMSSDIYPTLHACVEGTLTSAMPSWKTNTVAVGVVIISGGYPDSYPKGKLITGVEEACKLEDLLVFHAGTSIDADSGGTVTSGGRVLVVVGLNPDLKLASKKAMEGVAKINFDGAFHRKDIAHKALRKMASLLTYKGSGVDIEAGDSLVQRIKSLTKSTNRSGVASSIGGFGGVFDTKVAGYNHPLLVSGTDGVGTKLKLAQSCGIHDSVGIDLVAMCVNDILTQGAEPLFFLDYFGCGHLDVGVAHDVIKGIAQGCRESNCALLGGETAEMPGMYPPGEYDLAGFAVGAVEKSRLLPRIDDIVQGDVLIGLASSGVHSNGFSLLRKILERVGLKYSDAAPYQPSITIGESMLIPTRLYVRVLLGILQKGLVKAAAHITGGGILDNIPRVLPKGLGATLDANTWTMPKVFKWIASLGFVSSVEMLRSFNCGLGMVLVVDKSDSATVIRMLKELGEEAPVVGHVVTPPAQTEPVTVLNFKVAEKFGEEKPRKRVAVLISGSGTNLQSLINHTQDPIRNSSAEITLVISNSANAAGLKRAQDANITTKVVNHKEYKSRVEFDMAVHAELQKAGIQIVVLAGFMRILSEEFVKLWQGRLINIHPSLLPSFPGMHVHRQVLQSGVRVTGCTVHFVDTGVDTGGIISQSTVPVLLDDTEDSLAERVKLTEHEIYPQALELLANGKVHLGPNGKTIHVQ